MAPKERQSKERKYANTDAVSASPVFWYSQHISQICTSESTRSQFIQRIYSDSHIKTQKRKFKETGKLNFNILFNTNCQISALLTCKKQKQIAYYTGILVGFWNFVHFILMQALLKICTNLKSYITKELWHINYITFLHAFSY